MEFSLQEVLNAEEEDSAIRLVGSINKGIRVCPERISKKDPICVDSILNAVTFTSAYTGQHTLIGRGAGGRETAGSVIRDIVSIAQKVSGQTAYVPQKAVDDHEEKPYVVVAE